MRLTALSSFLLLLPPLSRFVGASGFLVFAFVCSAKKQARLFVRVLKAALFVPSFFQSGSFFPMPNLRRLELQLTSAHLNLSLATLLRENAALAHLHLHLAEDLIEASARHGGRFGGVDGGHGGGRDGRGWVLRHQLQDSLTQKLDTITLEGTHIEKLHPVAFKVAK